MFIEFFLILNVQDNKNIDLRNPTPKAFDALEGGSIKNDERHPKLVLSLSICFIPNLYLGAIFLMKM